MLSHYLPKGYFLFVKEHPLSKVQALSYNTSRSYSFYEKLRNIKNVKLISMNVSTFDLIENSLGIAVITGSAGMEGLFRKKPCLVFGNVFLEYAPGAYRIRTNQECEQALRDLIQGRYCITDRDIKIYFKAMFNIMVHGSLDQTFMDPKQSLVKNNRSLVLGFMRKLREVYPV